MRAACADIAELDAGSVGKLTWPRPDDLTDMELTVTPDQGLWKGAAFKFTIKVSGKRRLYEWSQ
jgi:ubiquitin-conjugating enzyme E2 M